MLFLGSHYKRNQMKKILKFGVLPLLIILIAVLVYNYPRLNIITGFSAKSVCSCTFEAGRDLVSIEAGDNDINPIFYAKNVINIKEKSVTSSVFGLKQRKAIYKKGVGCILIPENFEKENNFKPNRKKSKNNLPYPYGNLPQKDTIYTAIDYNSLKKAVANAFDNKNEQLKRTRSVVVIYKDQIIAEK